MKTEPLRLEIICVQTEGIFLVFFPHDHINRRLIIKKLIYPQFFSVREMLEYSIPEHLRPPW